MNNEFEKNVDPNFDTDYLITACFADIIQKKEQKNNNKLDGLIWKSHTVENQRLGDSLSAIIYPDCVNKCIEIHAVYEDTFAISHQTIKQINSVEIPISKIENEKNLICA